MAKASTAKAARDALPAAIPPSVAATATVEQYAFSLIQKYYQRLIDREVWVLKDKDPEDLHQMRVSIRRLQTALHIFKEAIVLPKAAQIKSLQAVTKRLGKLRDLDVQLDTLKTDYADKLDPSEHNLLAQAIAVLAKQRKQAFYNVEKVLSSKRYQALKVAYESWLAQPCYTSVAQQPLTLVLPELLSPLLAALLLHPGWLIAADDQAAIMSSTLHDLRKTCKHVRYQAEFFTDFYDPAFKDWIQEIKGLQDSLGKVHDIQVLQQILIRSVPEWEESIHLRHMIEEQHEAALGLWRSVQAKYLSPEYRLFLHQLLLSPLLPPRSQPAPEDEKVDEKVKEAAIGASIQDGASATVAKPHRRQSTPSPKAATPPKAPTARKPRSTASTATNPKRTRKSTKQSTDQQSTDQPPADGTTAE